jgi:hypothetical protein
MELVPDASQLVQAVRRDLAARYQYYAHVAGILLDVEAHRELGQLLRRPELGALAIARTDLPRKYLWPCLSRHLDRRGRLAVMQAHYRFLAERADRSLPARLLDRPETLWERRDGDDDFTVTLRYPRRLWDLEGELILVFEMNGLPLYTLWLSFAEGSTFGRPERWALLVGGIQGNVGRLDLMKAATKGCDDLAPRTILLAAAAGLAGAFAVDVIVAVGNDGHITRHVTPPEKFPFDYDRFWTEMGAVRDGHHFVLSVPLREKPLELVAATHRRRAQQRRALREQLCEAVRARAVQVVRRGE